MSKPMTQEQVTREAISQVQSYANDNAWFRFESGDPANPMTPAKFAFAAGKAYAHVNPVANFMVLGDTKLRSDPEFVKNFGLSEPDSDDDVRCFGIAQSLAPATASSSSSSSSASSSSATSTPSTSSSPFGSPPPSPFASSSSSSLATRAAGSIGRQAGAPSAGSILSNPYWSPMLNDAYILAGLHHNWKFAYGLVGDEVMTFDAATAGMAATSSTSSSSSTSASSPTITASSTSSVSSSAPKAEQTAAGMKLWKAFFLARPQTLWDSGRNVPRVFARELIGLRKFGYKAIPLKNQLTFECSNMGEADTATFDLYLQLLRDLAFHKAESKKAILQYISQFLFGGPDELSAIS